MVFKRKLYDEILRWKAEMAGQYALLIKGARRVGKSTLAEEFAKREYDSYILIDFYTKDYHKEGMVEYLPMYYAPML